MSGSKLQGETALWRAVVDQAISDATLGRLHLASAKRRLAVSLSSERLRQMTEARRWLAGTNRDFRDVCAYADLDPEAVVARARQLTADFDTCFSGLTEEVLRGGAGGHSAGERDRASVKEALASAVKPLASMAVAAQVSGLPKRTETCFSVEFLVPS